MHCCHSASQHRRLSCTAFVDTTLRVHMQVTTTRTGYNCNCDTFRQLAGTDDEKCLHTIYIQSLSQSAAPPPSFSPSETVVPIRSSAQARPYAYWIDDSFIFTSTNSQQLRCSRNSDKTCCHHTEAVKSFLRNSSADGLDDKEQACS